MSRPGANLGTREGLHSSVGSTRTRPALRRFALVLAAAQLLAYSAAPVIEALTERSPGPASIERAHSQSCTPIHQPSACLACQMLTAHARKADADHGRFGLEEASSSRGVEAVRAAPRAPPGVLRTRSPPLHLA